MTDYKVQGKTLDYFILCIGPRKGIRPTLSLTDLYVLVSRVRQGKRLYVLGFDPKEEGDHLRKLKHSPVLGIWRAGYGDDGRWDAKRAARFAAELAACKAAAAKARRRQPCGKRGAKRAASATPVEKPSKRPVPAKPQNQNKRRRSPTAP